MRVVGLREKADNGGALFGVVEEEEAESLDGGATHVVIDVRDGDVQ